MTTTTKTTMPTATCCQSCAIPLGNMQLGTESDGTPNTDYCRLCYADGVFTTDLTLEEMIEAWVGYLAQAGAEPAGPEEYPLPSVLTDPDSATLAGARRDLKALLPTLKRWRDVA